MKTIALTLRWPEALWTRVRAIADKSNTSIQTVITIAMLQTLGKRLGKMRRISRDQFRRY
jgi:hypothetical protein